MHARMINAHLYMYIRLCSRLPGLARSHMDIAQEREEEKKRKEADDEDSGADDAEVCEFLVLSTFPI